MDIVNYLQTYRDKPTLLVLCGLQCSGKSTYAKELIKSIESTKPDYKTIIVSSDKIREENPNLPNDKVFNKVYADINYWLRHNDNVILDATNITIKARRQIFARVTEPCYKIIHVFNTPFNECVKRLEERNNSDYPFKFSKEIIEKYYHSFQIPFYEEGWDAININKKWDKNYSDKIKDTLLKAAEGYNQQNKHHTQDLGQHLKSVYEKCIELNTKRIVQIAGYFHDVGKLFTQTIGPDGQAHYYDHANVGTYILLCNCGMYEFNNGWYYDTKKTLDWLFYINYHMLMHNMTKEKTIKKWTEIFSEEKFKQLKLLNQADCSNHVED